MVAEGGSISQFDDALQRSVEAGASFTEPHHAVQALRTSLLDQAEVTGHVTLQHERAKVARPRDGGAREKP